MPAARETRRRIDLASPALWLSVIGICAVGLLLRIAGFNRGMWEDEITVAYYTQIGLQNVVGTLAQNGAHPPLYFLVAAFDGQHGMDIVPAIRLPSLVAGVATIVVVYLLVLKLAGRAGALVAGALTAVAPVTVWYSDEGRMYAMVWFFVLLSFLLLVWGHESRLWPVYVLLHAIAVGLALWTDYSAALALIPQPIVILLLKHRWWFMGSWAVGWLSILPWLFFLREQYGRIEAQRFPGLGNDRSSWAASLLDLAWVRADYASLGNTLTQPATLALLVLLASAAAVTVVAAVAVRALIGVMAACLTVGALLVAAALAFQGTVAVVVPRALGIITFGFVLMFAAAAALLIGRKSPSTRVVGVTAALAVVLCTSASEVDVAKNGSNGTTWDAVADTINNNAQLGDELIYYPIAAKYAVDPYLAPSSPFRAYFDGSWPEDDGTADQNFANWSSGKPRVWFVYLAITGVDMPQHDQWFIQHNLCRVTGDPNQYAGLIEYQATTTHC
jgi:hypothetical protein